MFSNLGADLSGDLQTIETILAQRIGQALEDATGEIGKWTLAWGPAVFQAQFWGSHRADNLIYIAKRDIGDSITSELVVAIAGTNTSSPFDWLVENIVVNPQAPWLYGFPPADLKPMIAAGTATGLVILQSLAPGPKMPGAGKSILNFIEHGLITRVNITVTGHSLGGAQLARLGRC